MTREWLDKLTDDELKMLRAWQLYSQSYSAGWLYANKIPDNFQSYLDQASEELGTSDNAKIAFKDHMMSESFMLTDKDLEETLVLIHLDGYYPKMPAAFKNDLGDGKAP